jgi:methylmalonyl-CoA mutase, C-terminal domain
MMKQKTRFLLGKIGLDGHTTGMFVVGKALSSAGMEVIFGGIRVTPAQMASTALQEDVDAIGVSMLSGSHMTAVPSLLNQLKEKGIDKRVSVFVGGIIPPEDIPKLKEMGVREVFTPGADLGEIVQSIQKALD